MPELTNEPKSPLPSRRDALRAVLANGALLAASSSIPAVEASEVEVEFVPENDYPYFGYDATSSTSGRPGLVASKPL